jgi:Putative Ice-binding-like adhesive domain
MGQTPQSSRRGTAVPLAALAVIVLLVMGIGLLSLGLNTRLYSGRTVSEITARSAADSGLTMALFEMNQKLETKPWSDSTLPQATDVSLPYCNATCSYKVGGDLSGGYLITSYGESGQTRRTVHATLGLKGLFDHAVLTRASLTMKADTVVDGYNSVDPLDTSSAADLGTQSTLDSSIILNAGVVVNGDVRVGIGGDPQTGIKDLGATIAGFKWAATEKDPLPEIVAPDTLFPKGSAISAKGSTVTISPADNGTYTGIDLKRTTEMPGVLTISGGDVELHIAGNIDLGQACQIVLEEGSSLTLYVDGDIQCREGSGINVTNAAKEADTLKLYATGENPQTFDIKANSEWIGTIYAPNADVSLYAGGDAYGTVVANSFEFKAGGSYHYDRALKKVSVNDEGVRFTVERWREE